MFLTDDVGIEMKSLFDSVNATSPLQDKLLCLDDISEATQTYQYAVSQVSKAKSRQL